MWDIIYIITGLALAVALARVSYNEGRRKRGWDDYQAILRAHDRERQLELRKTRLEVELRSLKAENRMLERVIEDAKEEVA